MLLTRFPVASGSRRNVEAQTPYGALDVSMPVMSGIEVAEELTRLGNKAKIVFLTVHEDHDILNACRAAGGLGYVIKVFMDTDLVPAINEALAGHRFTSCFPSLEGMP